MNCKQKILKYVYNYIFIYFIFIFLFWKVVAHKKSASAGNFVNCFIKTQFNAFCDQIVNWKLWNMNWNKMVNKLKRTWKDLCSRERPTKPHNEPLNLSGAVSGHCHLFHRRPLHSFSPFSSYLMMTTIRYVCNRLC